jgi:hypothetical protein
LLHRDAASDESGALRRHHDAESRTELLACHDQLRHAFQAIRDLRDQDGISAAGDSGVQCNPSRIPSHDFHDHDAMVCLRRRVQPVDGIGRDADGGVESERARSLDDVVVDGFGHSHQRNAALVEFVGNRERAVAADHDERVEAEVVEGFQTAGGAVDHAAARRWIGERIPTVGGSQYRAAAPKDPG